jgi:hypothetical protein
MSVTINIRESGNVTILEVAGRLTFGTPDHPFRTPLAICSTASTRMLFRI